MNTQKVARRKLPFTSRSTQQRGVLFAVKINKRSEVQGIVEEMKDKVKEITPIEAHCQLGHLSLQAATDAATRLRWHPKGDFEKCEDCAIGKGHQQNVNKQQITRLLTKLENHFWTCLRFSIIRVLKWTTIIHENITGRSCWVKIRIQSQHFFCI
jgi:uncharacterized protein (UPF0248 family)